MWGGSTVDQAWDDGTAAAKSFEAAIESLRRPVEFAAALDGQNLERVHDLPGVILRACGLLCGLAIPQDLQSFFGGLLMIFIIIPYFQLDIPKFLLLLWPLIGL